MRHFQYFFVIALLLISSVEAIYAEEKTSLSSELESLNLPANQIPTVITEEKMYSVQSRHNNLKFKPELSANFSQKISDTGFITSREFGGGLRFYFNSRWSLGFNGSMVFNNLSSTSQELYKERGILTSVPYIKYRADLTTRFHTMYGKFRMSMDKVLYLDQYIALGPGMVALSTGNTPAAVGDIGISFWLGKNWNTKIGIKDYLYQEKREKSNELVNQLLVYIDAGFLLGGA